MPRISTGALTDMQLAAQNRIYSQYPSYDYVIIGSGMSALVVGALLANAGYKICLLEAHDVPGGYAHTFFMNDFHFCAQVHYIWGCAPGQPIFEFLRRIGLEEDIKFLPHDPEGYDHMVMPDGKRVKIPYGFDQLITNINSAYPGQEPYLKKFFNVFDKLTEAINLLPLSRLQWWEFLTQAQHLATLLKYKNKTLQNVFDECHLNRASQAILNANTGDLMCPPDQVSVWAFHGLIKGYNAGAYYPEKHFKYYTERLASFITQHEGCHIFYETEVTKINVSGDSVESLETRDGKTFKGTSYICNMDPKKTSQMIGRDRFPKKELAKLDYRYSPSSLIIYLGIKDIDLRDYGFGDFNIWHLQQWDLNKTWREIQSNNYDKPWIFYSTPTLHTPYNGIVPKGCQILELGTAANYEFFKQLFDEDPNEYRKQKRLLAQNLLDVTASNYIPNLQKYIALKVVGSPLTSETYCFAPFGNCYGSDLIPQNMGLERLTSETPWNNLYWCNASSGYPGIYGTTVTGMNLYTQLTHDDFYNYDKAPTPQEALAYAKQLYKSKQLVETNIAFE
jgi:all-trans-retinol 13,14-reductase